jgi:hypothetical protein
MVGVVQHEAPEIFNRRNKLGHSYKLSNSSVQRFLHRELGWSVRRATCAAQKLPSNVENVLLRSFLRMACLIRDEEIPACCIINADQTQVVYSAGSASSWNETGQRQVSILGADEKRAFTLMVSISMSGKVLPPQAIYSGKTTRSVPDASSAGFAHAKSLGIRFVPSLTTNYWATLGTMQSYIIDHAAPFLLDQISLHGLPPTQQCILQIDCWLVHRSVDFRSWMSAHFPWITLLYVPGGCTGLFQAWDVGVQCILKLAIRQASHEDVVQETLCYAVENIEKVRLL